MAEPTGKNRRTLRGLLINPREQLRLSFWIGGGWFVVLLVVLGGLLIGLNMQISGLESKYGLDHDVMFELRKSQTILILIATGVTGLATLLSIGAGIQMTHRIFGPIVPFLRHVNALKEGDTSSRVRLRDGDSHQELAGALNELAENLERKTKA